MLKKLYFLLIFIILFIYIPAYPKMLKKGDKAINFTLKNLQGKKISLSHFLKKKVIIIDFWATWCPTCIKEIKYFNKVYKKFKKKGLIILGINFKEEKKKIVSFSKKIKILYPVLLDTKGKVAKKYGILGIPSVIIINKKGRIVYYGYSHPKNIKKFLK
jgi:peroxiredoxin